MPSDPRGSQSLPDLRYIHELAKVFQQYELGEVEIETGEQRILLRRHAEGVAVSAPQVVAPQAVIAAPVAAAPESPPAAVEPKGDFITSPFVGTFYRSARPDTPAFVEVGQRVEAGTTVCLVEAMKLFNEIEAETACVIEEILVDNASAVEFGTRLFRVRKP